MDEPADLTFVIDSLTPRGGMENALIALVRELANDFRVTVIALSGSALTDDTLPPAVTVTYLNVPIGSTRLLRSIAPLRRALVRRPRPVRLVSVGLWCTAVLGWVMPRRLNRCVVWEHSLTAQRLSVSPKMRVLWLLAQPAFRRSGALVAVSDVVRDQLVRVPRRRGQITVIPNSVDTGPEQSQSPREQSGCDALRLLGVGSLVAIKNWGLAIRALSHLPPSTSLSIAGDGPERAALGHLVRDLGLQSRVHLLGHRNDVGALMAEFDLLVHSSLSETFGYTLLEAAGRGLPVVACDLPIMNQLVPRLVPGVLVEATPASFAAGVQACVELRPGPSDWAESSLNRHQEFGKAKVVGLWRHVLLDEPGSEVQRAGWRGSARWSHRRSGGSKRPR